MIGVAKWNGHVLCIYNTKPSQSNCSSQKKKNNSNNNKNKARKKKLEQLLQWYGKKITKSVLPKIK